MPFISFFAFWWICFKEEYPQIWWPHNTVVRGQWFKGDQWWIILWSVEFSFPIWEISDTFLICKFGLPRIWLAQSERYMSTQVSTKQDSQKGQVCSDFAEPICIQTLRRHRSERVTSGCVTAPAAATLTHSLGISAQLRNALLFSSFTIKSYSPFIPQVNDLDLTATPSGLHFSL